MSKLAEDVASVVKAFPAGTRLRCPRNGKTYQIGKKFGVGQFWLMCEQDGAKGPVDAALVLREFEAVKE